MDSDSEPTVSVARRKRARPKKKLHIVFDEDARREFLTGFRKRKLLRKKVAQEELKQQLKIEKKRIKNEAKERFKKMTHTFKPLPELEKQMAKVYDIEESEIRVLDLDPDILMKTNYLIGRNRAQYDEDKDVKEETNDLPNDEPIGMELKTKSQLKREVKNHATDCIKNSKVFQRKNNIERHKQKKISLSKKKNKQKLKKKQKRKNKR